MSDKISTFRVLLMNLSRLPGLGFLSQYEGQVRDAVVGVEDYADAADDMKNAVSDVGNSAKQLASRDDD